MSSSQNKIYTRVENVQLLFNIWVPDVPLRFFRVPFFTVASDPDVGEGIVGCTVVVVSITSFLAITKK